MSSELCLMVGPDRRGTFGAGPLLANGLWDGVDRGRCGNDLRSGHDIFGVYAHDLDTLWVGVSPGVPR
jgi:hypothetical protein